ncbi:azurin [uncultured Algibacter sp.]|uniref:azurin n=1 Tax=uncultured Algibacter sp. TaxID=298659 RepID=UPI0026200DE8|nr:azurin [uncultured Algibacter sp.]
MKTLRIIVLAIFSITVIGCGGKEEKKKEGFSYEKKSEVSKKAESNPNDVIITSNDAMQFNKKEIKVKAGQKVKLTLKHIGKLDVNVMGHNIVILKKGVDLTAFAAKAATQRDNKYIPKNSEDIIAHSDLIGGGQVSVVEFDAPEAGTYEFLCSFPGHSGLMKGKFIVE